MIIKVKVDLILSYLIRNHFTYISPTTIWYTQWCTCAKVLWMTLN